jgi:transcription-repair coupling factor (superfamily II helicase)
VPLSNVFKAFSSRLISSGDRVYSLTGSSAALYLAGLDKPFLMIERTEESAQRLYSDIRFYRDVLKRREELLYLPSADGPERSGLRAEAAHRLTECDDCSIVASVEAMGEPLWGADAIESAVVEVSRGAELDRDSFEESLKGLGYVRVPLVTEHGQYSRRGFIFDVFPSTKEAPVRIEFFGDVVDSIRVFDVDTQRSKTNLEGMVIYPSTEVENGREVSELVGDLGQFVAEGAYDEPPEGAFVVSRYAIQGEGEGTDAGVLPVAGLGVLPDERKGLDDLPKAVKRLSAESRVVIVCSSPGQAERLREILRDGDVISPLVKPRELIEYEGSVSITIGELSAGIYLPGLVVLTELEIFGGRPAYRSLKRSRVSKLLTRVEDLERGDLVVHYDHGIGRFEGLVRQVIDGNELDLMTIDYAEGGRLYLPLHAIDKIKKYHSEEASVPKLDRLGTKTWQRKRERVRKRIKELAAKLLKIYAHRKVTKGFSFSADTEMHREFDSFFPYEETADQIKAIADIKGDMESEEPMDRLLAGDVGYGKTEVAMRAAFKAVFDGKQVAVLVPTTLLCEQHLRIFKKRFSAFPVTVDYLSRFKSAKEQRKTLEDMRKGRVDIIIATHALLKKDVSFRYLGLLVIDEEHRFGVRQKERIKELKGGVDVLALSATPIPRTLQMSLSGIRKMSVIETPPEERVATKSTVSVFNEALIKDAVEKELQRGGQVFFVHNRIHDIEKYSRLLGKLLPDARVAVAHGRMTERALEKIMLKFLNLEVDVLVSTAIVGSGLDIPSANTIIIDMAHRMGLADLYQLKGRVGRSDIRAYAYFLIPGQSIIPEDARKRLQAIQELNYMGAGFRLAMKDLEIRGAGNMLGAEQSGNIDAVGFDLYIEMLEKAVSELKGLDVREPLRTSVSVGLDAFIPDSYIDDVTLRLSAYRSISGAGAKEDLDSIRDEMRDRFGKPPEEFLNLLMIMELRLKAEVLGVAGITQSGKRIKFIFPPDAQVLAEKVIKVFGKGVRFYPDGFDIAVDGSPFDGVMRALELMSKAIN